MDLILLPLIILSIISISLIYICVEEYKRDVLPHSQHKLADLLLYTILAITITAVTVTLLIKQLITLT